MNERAAPMVADDELHRLLIHGGLRNSMGLVPKDLQLGLTIARDRMLRGAHFDAFRIYAILVLLDPMDAGFQLGLANCTAQLCEYDLCLQAASAAIAIAPTHPRAYYFSGRACLFLGHVAEAEEDLMDAIRHGRSTGDSVIVREAEVLLSTIERAPN